MRADEAIDWLAAEPTETGLFTDFDGTLSEIVRHAEEALPLPGAVDALEQLADKLAVVAVVSGRPASFLVDRLGLTSPGRLQAYGLHGLEHTDGGAVEVSAGAERWRATIGAVVRHTEEMAAAGVEVEDKVYGVTLHWRRASDPEAAADAAEAVVDEAVAAGLVPRRGKASVELVTPLGIDKGSVVRQWAGMVSRVAFVGDDLGDVLAFEAIAALDDPSSGHPVEGLRVAVGGSEAPVELLAQADLVLPGPREAVAWLKQLAARVGSVGDAQRGS